MAGRILIVDDEESILITMQAVLEQDGYAVATASTGAVASDLLHEATFDVAFVDLRLDDMDGLEIVALLRQRSPETMAIVLTGYASLDSAVGALRRGAYDYLTKPCDTEELKATVARALERRRLGAATCLPCARVGGCQRDYSCTERRARAAGRRSDRGTPAARGAAAAAR